MTDAVLTVATWVLLIVGSLFSIIGGIGLLRLPDFFTRIHAGGVTDTMGAGAILLGLMLHSGLQLATLKLVMILFFLLVTSPTATHALAKSAVSRGVRPLLADDAEDGPSPI